MRARVQNAAVRFVVCISVVSALTAIYHRVLHVNPTTVALTLLLAVLIVAAAWGLRYAVFMSLVCTAVFNFYFLPPFGTFTIADPQNWIALFAFLVTAVLASHLSDRARKQTLAANRRRREVERLYHFTQQMLVTDNILELVNAVPRLIVEEFGLTTGAMYLTARQQLYYADVGARSLISAEELKTVAGRAEPTSDPRRGVSFVPLRIGVRAVGSIAVVGTLSWETLEAISSLISIAIERAGAVEKLTHAEASRENERLRSALLDSVTHDFRTPLTGIKAAVTALTSDVHLDEPQQRELLTVIEQETDRLNRLIGEAAEMAQLDARQVQLEIETRPIADAIRIALQESKPGLANHQVEVTIPPDLPLLRMDVKRVAEVLRHLLHNATKYSPPASPIRVSAERFQECVRVSVADRGPGIDDFEQLLIFDKFYRGTDQRSRVQGTGMGLAIAKAIIEAHGGTMNVASQLGQGSVFSIILPVS